jgi:hypothetical protein
MARRTLSTTSPNQVSVAAPMSGGERSVAAPLKAREARGQIFDSQLPTPEALIALVRCLARDAARQCLQYGSSDDSASTSEPLGGPPAPAKEPSGEEGGAD